MTSRYLSSREAAHYVQLGSATVDNLISRGLFAQPDVIVGRTRGWLPETLDAWKANRPGQGARTDLQRKKQENSSSEKD